MYRNGNLASRRTDQRTMNGRKVERTGFTDLLTQAEGFRPGNHRNDVAWNFCHAAKYAAAGTRTGLIQGRFGAARTGRIRRIIMARARFVVAGSAIFIVASLFETVVVMHRRMSIVQRNGDRGACVAIGNEKGHQANGTNRFQPFARHVENSLIGREPPTLLSHRQIVGITFPHSTKPRHILT